MNNLLVKLNSFLKNLISCLDVNPAENWLESIFTSRRRLLSIGIAVIVVIQTYYYIVPVDMNADYRRADATGFNHLWGQEFFYHFYYNDLFPLVSRAEKLEYSKEGARANLYEKSDSLLTEYNHWSRFGESARIWLYMPYAILTSSAKDPQIRFTNYLHFTLTLIFLYYLFWKRRKTLLGIILSIILGCSPFMVYEIHCNDNIFGLMASNAILLTALYLPTFDKEYKNQWLIIPLIAGIMSGVFYHIRAESAAILLSPLLIIWLNRKIRFHQSLLLSFLLLGSFLASNLMVKNHFVELKSETNQLVAELGGTPFEGEKTLVHPLWHPLFIGLGDFDTKYGHGFHDTAFYNYALKVLRKQTGEPLVYPGRTMYEMGEYYDEDSLYYKKVETIPGYAELVKKHFIEDVSNDPLWYSGLLLKRVQKFLFHLSPIGISIYKKAIPIPFHGILIILFVVLLAKNKKWFWIKLCLFTLPLGLSVIAIFYSANNSYQSIFHLFSFSTLAYCLIGYFMGLRQRKFSQ